MPIYEYRCRACKKDFELLQNISEPPLATCPECGKRVRQLISQTSFTLKGGGWYKDGYAASKGPREGSGAKEGSGEKTPAAKPEKSESKKPVNGSQ